MVGLQDIVSDGPTHRLPMENRPCKHGSLTTTIPPVSDRVHAIMRPTSGLLVLALASRAGLSSQVLGTLSGWPPCLLCLPMRACAQPGLAVRAVSAIGAHLELAGRLGMVGLGMIVAIAGRRPRSGASRRRASLSRPCTSQQGWPRSVVWVSSQRKLAEHRAAVPQLRQGSLAGGSACAVEAPPSSQTASHAAPAQGRAGPQRVPRPGFGG